MQEAAAALVTAGTEDSTALPVFPQQISHGSSQTQALFTESYVNVTKGTTGPCEILTSCERAVRIRKSCSVL